MNYSIFLCHSGPQAGIYAFNFHPGFRLGGRNDNGGVNWGYNMTQERKSPAKAGPFRPMSQTTSIYSTKRRN
jgi:hypothetical protein